MGGGTDPALSRAELVALLEELGRELEGRGVKGHLFVVGGAAMALAFNTDRLTRDVDAVFEPKTVVYEAARHVAERHSGLRPDWLNDGVKALLPGTDPAASVIIDLPGLAVSVPSARYLLALKVHAARVDRDPADILILARAAGARTAEDVLDIAESVIGPGRLLPKSEFMVREAFVREDPLEAPAPEPERPRKGPA